MVIIMETVKESNNKEVKGKQKVIKSRYFFGLLYPESLPEDWLMKLESIGQPMAISPLHDKDIDMDATEDSSTGEVIYKKPHYHFIYIANNPVTENSVLNKIRRALGNDRAINKVTVPFSSLRNYYDYLSHESKDAIAKRKFVYDKADIQLLNNFDISRYDQMDVEEKNRALMAIVNMIRHERLQNINDLWDYLEEEGYDLYDLNNLKVLDVLKTNSNVLRLCFDAAYQTSTRMGGRKRKTAKTAKMEQEQQEEEQSEQVVVMEDQS